MILLFTGGGGAGNQAIYRILRKKYNIYFADAKHTSFSPDIPRSRCYKTPFAKETDYTFEVLGLIDKLGVDVVVPGVDEELVYLKELESVRSDIRVLTPEVEYIKLMLDKLLAFKKLDALGVDVPWTSTAESSNKITFPCIVKPRVGRGSRGFKIIESEEKLDAYCILSKLRRSEILVQEMLVGEEYTVIMSADSSRSLRSIVPIRVQEKQGITIRGNTESSNEVLCFCEELHKKYPASGCYNIQLIVSAQGRVRPFEINPRISTTFCLALASGIDPIKIYTSNDKFSGLAKFRTGVELFRNWDNSFYGL